MEMDSRKEFEKHKNYFSHYKVHLNYLMTQRKQTTYEGNPIKIFIKPHNIAKLEKSQ